MISLSLPFLQRIMGMRHPVDGGPMYYETNLERLIQEPWNGVSAFLFLFIVGYWAYRLRGQYRNYLFMTIAVPILAIGGIGGTIYHLFRIHPFFLFMDWLPIMVLCVGASGYFLARLLNSTWKGIAGVVLFFVTQFAMFGLIQAYAPSWMSMGVNLNYMFMAAFILLPAIFLLRRNKGAGGRHLAAALVCFSLAISFRFLDPYPQYYVHILPMGSHFLWHLFGALACHFMYCFVYAADTYRLKRLTSSIR